MKKNKFSFGLLIDLVIVFLFIEPIIVLGVNSQILSALYFISVYFLVKRRFYLDEKIIMFSFLVILISFLVFIWHQNINSYAVVLFRMITAVIIAHYLVLKYKGYNSLIIVSYSSLVHVVIILLQILLPGFKNVWFMVVQNTSAINLGQYTLSEVLIRSNGANGFLYADNGIIFCISAVILTFFSNKSSIVNKIVLVCGGLISGRSSFIVLIPFVYFEFYKKKIIYKFIFLVSIFVCLVTAMFYMSQFFPNYFKWISEPILNFIDGKSLSQSSDSTFRRHLFFFSDVYHNIIGYGIFSMDNSQYFSKALFPSDSGYMRLLTSGGLFQLGGYICSILYLYLITLKNTITTKTKKLFIFSLFYYSVVFLFSLKSQFIYSNFNFLMIFILYLLSRIKGK
ncbi:hypothetical protein C0W96_12865 [Photobacterium kishitanii]|uniref:hypothetical protein n=1 Tax=Photobacterium kishitanii TaxID=318456 RepID=UPI0005D3194B|nr:hypothetical protein [Photobacterium kishitanii]KJG09234.1 hypothetical protein UB40_13850 [Photobacterium kishitanii]PSV05549.1 hypothetical protein C0W96_12865 [Photobacterium kishitanii]PSV76458.1 hypothetical protein C0W29_05865 [Photobacterium kishitanii]